MTEKLSIALAQLNPTVGDVAGNIAKLREARKKAAAQGVHLIMTPELYVCGYPPEDLVQKLSFQSGCAAGGGAVCQRNRRRWTGCIGRRAME